MQLQTTAQSLTQNENRACIAAATKEGIQTAEMRNIAFFRRHQIRDNPNAEADIISNLNAVAGAYGAREKLDKETISAAVDFVRQHFAFLAAPEIQKAYEMNAAGLLEERAETWGGRFSVDQLGKILSNYTNHRRRLMAAYIRETEAIREAERQAEREEAMRQQFEDVFLQKMEFVKEHGTSWEDVPEFWYDELKKRGAVRMTKQKGEDYYQKALEVATKAAREQNELALLTPPEQRFKEVFKIEPESYAKTVARKMVVFDIIKQKF